MASNRTTRAHIIEMAECAFGSEEADSWLRTRWRVFDNKTPLELASNRSEAKRVEDYIANLLGADAMMMAAGTRAVAS